MAVTVVFGRQRVSVTEAPEPTDPEDGDPQSAAPVVGDAGTMAADDNDGRDAAAADVGPPVCTLGRGSRQDQVDVVLGTSALLSRRAGEVRCIDGAWWQIRQVGRNGLVVRTERGAVLPVTAEWCDVPARFGVAYVTVTTPMETIEFKVEPNVSGTRDAGAGRPTTRTGAKGEPVPTRLIPRVGYWRVGVALCEPALRDESEHIPSNPEIVLRLDALGLEAPGFTTKAVEKRIKYLYEITGIAPGDRAGLRRRLIDARVVTLDDVIELLRTL